MASPSASAHMEHFMSKVGSVKKASLLGMPTEILTYIAIDVALPTKVDLSENKSTFIRGRLIHDEEFLGYQDQGIHHLDNFKNVSQCTRDLVNDGRFWRQLYLAAFNIKRSVARQITNNVLKERCKERLTLISWPFNFAAGVTGAERQRLEMVKELVVEAFSDAQRTPKNIIALEHFISRTNILITHREKYGAVLPLSSLAPFLVTVQLVLAPYIMNSKLVPYFRSHSDLRRHMYSPDATYPLLVTTRHNYPIINGLLLMDFLNFFRYHTRRSTCNTLYEPFKNLAPYEVPRMFDQHLSHGARKLARYWKFSYAHLDDETLHQVRIRGSRADEGCDIVVPNPVHEAIPEHIAKKFDKSTLKVLAKNKATFPTFEMEFPDVSPASWWNEQYEHLEQYLPSVPRQLDPVSTRAQSIPFKADGYNDSDDKAYDGPSDFSALGWLNPLPPQSGIPGWQRFGMLLLDSVTGDLEFGGTPIVFEGIVLPGGNMILGRWYAPVVGEPVDEAPSGPFMAWAYERGFGASLPFRPKMQ